MVEAKTKKTKKHAGDALIGIGAVIAIICLVLGFFSLDSGSGPVWPWFLMNGGLLLVITGYLQRIVAELS